MNKVVGIIAEYNPFHNGHRYQIEQIRKRIKNAAIIAVMSGNFTQRGEPAILNKFTRATLAVNGGCDLVLELPFTSAVRSAQDFARGGVNLLKDLGIVDVLAFGAEIDDIGLLKQVANRMSDTEFKSILHDHLNTGISYANAICQTLSELINIPEKILCLPNVILSIEYLRALESTKIMPLLIPRVAASHNDKTLHSNISSASSIRTSIYSQNPVWTDISKTVDSQTLNILKTSDLPITENLFRPLLTKIICSDASELRKIYGMTEGLENKLIQAVHSAQNLEEFINFIVSRRYTRTRIQRLLLYLLIGLTKEQVDIFDETHYARILAFNQRGRELIKLIKQFSQIPVITKITQHITSRAPYEKDDILKLYKENLKLDITSSNIFAVLHKNIQLEKDFKTSPIYCPS